MKQIFFSIIIFLFFINSTSCQTGKISHILNNESFKFVLVRTSTNILDSNSIEVSKTVVRATITANNRAKLKKVKDEDWIALLTNESTDWATNLYLYNFFNRDATQFEVIKTKEDWRKCCKEKDIEFWKKNLRKVL